VSAVVESHLGYDALYRAHHARVLRTCRLLLSDPDEAEEVCQEVFLKLFREHQGDTRGIAWGPWLTRVTVNACRDRRRSGWWKWWRDRHEEFHDVEFAAPGRSPEQEILSRETHRQVWEAFRDLSTRQREVFVLRLLEGWSTEVVAETLGLTAGSVKQHLFRAVRHLRAALRGRS
jgi:RNA polymerase sigma-70 factor (ECF subfamily)